MARILLTDDEAGTRDLVRRALEADGHGVVVMDSGTEALARLALEPHGFELVVTDVNMPGLDGLELAQHAQALNPGLAIVLMSGLVEQLERAKALKAHNYFTIAKPFTLEQMRALVRTALST